MYCSLSDDSLLCNLERISAASLVLTGVHWACMYYHWELLCGHISDAFYSNFSLNLAQSLYSHCSTRFAVAMSHPVLVLYLSMVHHQVVDYQALDKLAFSRCFSKALIYLQWYIAESVVMLQIAPMMLQMAPMMMQLILMSQVDLWRTHNYHLVLAHDSIWVIHTTHKGCMTRIADIL